MSGTQSTTVKPPIYHGISVVQWAPGSPGGPPASAEGKPTESRSGPVASRKCCRLWQKALVLTVGIICYAGTVQSADCNANGVEDALDLRPGELTLRVEHILDQISNPQAVVGGDWNSDGREDFATANWGSRDITVFVNRGDGLLEQPANYELEAEPTTALKIDEVESV